MDKLIFAMFDAGIHIHGEIDLSSREFQRFSVKGSSKSCKPLFVRLHDGGASFGDWRNPNTWKTIWYESFKKLTIYERKGRLQEQEKIADRKKSIEEHAQFRAECLFNHPACKNVEESHPYIYRKKIIPYNARQLRSYLILPIVDINLNLKSLQYIKPNGRKRFKRRASYKDAFVLLGSLDRDTVWICEGWATGCTIHEVTSQTVLCALSAQNIPNVALSLRRKYIKTHIKIAADCDEVGIKSAKKAASVTGAEVYMPMFDHPGPTDFNDLFVEKGLEELESFLLSSLKQPLEFKEN